MRQDRNGSWCSGGEDKCHVSKLLLSQLREVDTFFPSPVLVAGTVPRYILVSPSPSPMPHLPDVHELYIHAQYVALEWD